LIQINLFSHIAGAYSRANASKKCAGFLFWKVLFDREQSSPRASPIFVPIKAPTEEVLFREIEELRKVVPVTPQLGSDFFGSEQPNAGLEVGMRTAVFYLSIILAPYWAGGSQAQTRTNIAAGRQIAERLCAHCHAIGVDGKSAHPDAPPFREIAAKGNVENLEEALGEGIVVGHPDMPQFEFKPQDVGALIDYLKSLSGKG
jgi:mono/diheme cytochrome c family protein